MKDKIFKLLPTDKEIFYMFVGGIMGIVIHGYLTGTLFAN
jgi:hypothetical protein